MCWLHIWEQNNGQNDETSTLQRSPTRTRGAGVAGLVLEKKEGKQKQDKSVKLALRGRVWGHGEEGREEPAEQNKEGRGKTRTAGT